MTSHDTSDFDLSSTSNSHLLSETPLYLNTSHGADDLSISELSITDRPLAVFGEPFSLLAKPQPQLATPTKSTVDDDNEGEEEGSLETEEATHGATRKQTDERQREEKLRSDLFILKTLNAAFATYIEALDESASANERVAAQLAQTDALLNKYIDTLSKTEEYSRLILDEQWLGAEADEEQLERERREAQENARREAEEQRERERRAREEQERLEQERIERERQESVAARGAVRGVRGTRASGRGTRATARAGSSSASNTAGTGRLRAPSGSNTSTGSGVKRFTSTTLTRGTARRT
ncbi:hypothetical protein M378DRAFT_406934 [Amanita muscaria Koide BX008]|uniref:DASH complex subunit DUO1 n=1 Tax=Amanita muscaria (strain Koide BX008) TaxID=946122 RepID=A0A0C2XA72_AMAMK|nr:hypothetical protein M378DRAFT_406934 [Amanita muscaria Koide BX008]